MTWARSWGQSSRPTSHPKNMPPIALSRIQSCLCHSNSIRLLSSPIHLYFPNGWSSLKTTISSYLTRIIKCRWKCWKRVCMKSALTVAKCGCTSWLVKMKWSKHFKCNNQEWLNENSWAAAEPAWLSFDSAGQETRHNCFEWHFNDCFSTDCYLKSDKRTNFE